MTAAFWTVAETARQIAEEQHRQGRVSRTALLIVTGLALIAAVAWRLL